MDFKLKLFLLVAVVLVGVVLVTLKTSSSPKAKYKPGVLSEFDTALREAQRIYAQKKQAGFEFSNGPCLTNDLMSGWVADLVHNPRTQEDNLPENQCRAYLEGRARHFVELDLEGNLVRIR